jgi:hypothetical protein
MSEPCFAILELLRVLSLPKKPLELAHFELIFDK